MKATRISMRIFLFFQLAFLLTWRIQASELSDPPLNVIPYPQEVTITGESFLLPKTLAIVIDQNADPQDSFLL